MTDPREVALPPLPEPEGAITFPSRPYEPEWTSSMEAYSESQMQAYAREAIAADRTHREKEREEAAMYRLLRRGQHFSVIDGVGDDLRGEALDHSVRAAMSRTAGEGER